MKTMILSALAGLAIVGMSGAAEAKCIKAGGQATAVTPRDVTVTFEKTSDVIENLFLSLRTWEHLLRKFPDCCPLVI
jgi:hypothetical protein